MLNREGIYNLVIFAYFIAYLNILRTFLKSSMLDALLGSYYISIIYNHSSDVLLTFLSFSYEMKTRTN